VSLADLPVLTDRPRMAVPKYAAVSPSQKADTARKADEKALQAWRRSVQKRDGKVCRCCGRLVSSALTVAPERRECHHLVGRIRAEVRYDRRNGIQVCLGCHEQIERSLIHLVQKARDTFNLKGSNYLNGDKPIKFIRKPKP